MSPSYMIIPLIFLAIIIGLVAMSSRSTSKARDKYQKNKNAVANAVIDLYDDKTITMVTDKGETYLQKNDENKERLNSLSAKILQHGFKGKKRVTLTDFNDRMRTNRADLMETVETMASSFINTDDPNQRMSNSHQNNDTSFSMVLLLPALSEPAPVSYGHHGSSDGGGGGFFSGDSGGYGGGGDGGGGGGGCD